MSMPRGCGDQGAAITSRHLAPIRCRAGRAVPTARAFIETLQNRAHMRAQKRLRATR